MTCRPSRSPTTSPRWRRTRSCWDTADCSISTSPARWPTEHGPAARRLRIRTRLGVASACIVSATDFEVSTDRNARFGSDPWLILTSSHKQPLISRVRAVQHGTRSRRGRDISRSRMPGDGSLGTVFDHVGIAVSDLAAPEPFYRTVLSALGVEASHADAELIEWQDWDIGPTDREHPVTRGLHVGFRAPNRAAVAAVLQAGIAAGYPGAGA